MGPRIKFTREQIIDTAFEIAKTEGLDNVTIRKIAENMGSSVAPIYVNFESSSELMEALVDRITAISQQLLAEESSGNPFYDMGRASLSFAMEYGVLFRDLVMKQNCYLKDYDEKMLPVLVEEMKKDPEMKGFTDDELQTILFKMRVFQLGLSVMAANKLLPEDCNVKDLMDILSAVADDVLLATKIRKQN